MFTVYMIGTGRTAENFDVKYMPERDDINEFKKTEED